MTLDILELGIIFLAAAVTVVPLCKRAGLGSVLGYIAAGSLIGPWGLKLFVDSYTILHFAELGVVILFFLIGLELKPTRLWGMKKSIFGLGAAQVFATTLLISLLAFLFGLNVSASLVVGFGFSLSSTVFAIQLMSEKKQLNTQFGRSSFAILLFQDIITIPVLALIPLFAIENTGIQNGGVGIVVTTLIILTIIVGGNFLLRPMFRFIATSGTREIFTATSILIILFVSFVMTKLNLSMALGAFIAGLLLSDSEYRHQIEIDLEPFKDLLLGLFFMGIGMSVDYGIILKNPFYILIAVLFLFFVKFLVIYSLGKIVKFGNIASQNMALILSQGGELAFVIFAVALQYKLIDNHINDYATILITLSIIWTSLASVIFEKLAPLITKDVEEKFDQIKDEHPQVIIAGFGRVGQVAGRLLRVLDIPFTALELDSEQVEVIRKFGNKIYYGDASRLDLLQTAGAEHAKVFFLAIDDVEESLKTAAIVSKNFAHLKIIARARNRNHVYRLRDLGVTHTWRETWFSSIAMAKEILQEMGLGKQKINDVIDKFEKYDLELLENQYKDYNNEKNMIYQSRAAVEQLTKLLREDKKL